MPYGADTDCRRFSHVVFDLDGTLVDSAPDILHFLALVLREHGLEIPPLGTNLIGPLLEDIVRDLCPALPPSGVREIVAAYRKRYRSSDFPKTTVFPGIPPLFDALNAQDCRIYVATNKPEDVTRSLLFHKELLPHVADIACCDSVAGRQITKRDMLLLLMERHAVQSGQVVMIGDSVYDMLGGKQAGVATIAALYGYGQREALLETHPDYVVESASWPHVLRWPEQQPQQCFATLGRTGEETA